MLAVEKAGLVEQLSAWFGHYGVPIVALGGYASQSLVEEVIRDVDRYHRPAVLLYAGDHDPSGEDIDRDFVERTDVFAEVVRVALTAAQVEEYGLPPMVGKATDSRAAGFVRTHGGLVQVEVDALPPDVLRGLYAAELALWWDDDAGTASLDQERDDVTAIAELIRQAR
jgi:hypothetical protein